MRGAPHSGLSWLIVRIRSRMSAGTAGRPTRRCDLQRQYRRKPLRCQRTSVAGLKTTAASSKEGNSRYSQTKITRSAERSLSLAGADRCSTTSCWRRNAISASRAACDLNTSTSNPPSSFRRSIIPTMRVAHRGSCASPDAIFGSHRYFGRTISPSKPRATLRWCTAQSITVR